MADWINWIVITIVVGVGLAIFYSALKEPLDLLFGLIKAGLVGIKNKLTGSSDYYEEIRYG